MIKKLPPLLLLILIGCSEPEPIEFSDLVVRDNIHYTFKDDKVYTGEVINFDRKYSVLQGGYVTNKSKGYIENGKLNGPYKIYHQNGTLFIEGNFLNGKYEGLKRFYHNQILRQEENYTNGLRNGESITYWEDGTPQIITNYLNGETNGESITYWEDGTPQIITNYLNDKKEGKSFEYRKDGLLIEELNYKNGKLDGLNKYYNDLGKINFEYFYNDGTYKKVKNYTYYETGELKEEYFEISYGGLQNPKHGKYISYKKNGEIESEGEFRDDEPWNGFLIIESDNRRKEQNYVNGKLNGRSQEYYDGKLLKDIEYKNGVENGYFKIYFENGLLESDSNFQDGIYNGGVEYEYYENGNIDTVNYYNNKYVITKKVGYYQDGSIQFELTYDQNGRKQGLHKLYLYDKILSEINWKDGKEHGSYKRYWSNGGPEIQIYVDGNYKDGERDGLFKIYKPNGNLEKEEMYKDGILIKETTY